MKAQSPDLNSLPDSPQTGSQREELPASRSPALRIALSYVLAAALYIAISDRLAASLAPSKEALAFISQIKGWGFVLLTGVMLYAMLRRRFAEQEETELALRESAERLTLITSTMPVYLFEIDPAGTIVLATRRAPEMTAANIAGSSIYSWIGADRRDAFRMLVESALANRSSHSMVWTTREEPSRRRTYSLTVSSLHSDPDEPRLLITAFDITDIKNVEERARLQARLLDATGEAIIATDMQGGIWYWNDAAERMYGWKPAEILGQSCVNLLLSPSSHTMAREIFEIARTSGQWSGELLARRKDGTTFPSLVTISSIADAAGEITGFVVVSRDISEQKHTAEELARSHERFELIARATNDAVWDWDIAANRVWWNDTFYRAYGFSRDFETTLEGWIHRVHPDDRDRVLGSLHQALQKKNRTWSEEYRFMHASGSSSYVVNRGFLILDADGNPMRMVGSMVDVTSLKLAELDQRFLAEERQKLLQQLRLQFERMPIGYILLDKNFRIVEWNPSCQRIFGFARGEVLGRSPFDLIIPPDTRSHVREFFERLKSGDDTLTTITENVTKDGQTVLCEWFDTPLRDEHGAYAGIMAMVQDITERRQAEEALKRSSEKMRHLSAYLQTVREEERKHIAREIHDELGQELTALKMQAAYVQRAINRSSDPVDRDSLLELTGSLIGMTDGAIKTVRRIATELRPDVLDKVGLIDALKWQAQEFEKRTGVVCQFTSHIQEWNFPDEIATALFRIFQEALTNVSRHAAATRVAAELSLHHGWVAFTVQDNGRGITEEQIENTSSLGLLGLTERARLLGGTATIRGAPGRGTTVSVRIPLPSSNA